ncbi:type II secretion system protein GspK [Acetobacter estunensis]|uniref:type II secretion system protein GspK n=1 Tax=Acetobacter estunensis TaxID=104097 RepID=UPI001C2D9A89|nr:type II secretion system protein GspK [Acetobacter estunensis]MBV1836756.1 general secretion pathway protein GspK [Acetobacter estunensis]
MAAKPNATSEDGFALLLVLWTLGFLALIGSQALITGRAALRLENATLQRAKLETAADAAIMTELFVISTGQSHPTETWHDIAVDENMSVLVRSVDDRNRINPNVAGQALMAAFLTASGIPSDQAQTLAAGILAWRMPGYRSKENMTGAKSCTSMGLPVHTLEDLAAVPGMTVTLLHRIAPHLSFAQLHLPDGTSHDPVVRQAIARSSISNGSDQMSNAGDVEEESLIVVDATASHADHHMHRHAEVILLPDARPVPWRVVRWETETRDMMSSEIADHP